MLFKHTPEAPLRLLQLAQSRTTKVEGRLAVHANVVEENPDRREQLQLVMLLQHEFTVENTTDGMPIGRKHNASLYHTQHAAQQQQYLH